MSAKEFSAAPSSALSMTKFWRYFAASLLLSIVACMLVLTTFAIFSVLFIIFNFVSRTILSAVCAPAGAGRNAPSLAAAASLTRLNQRLFDTKRFL